MSATELSRGLVRGLDYETAKRMAQAKDGDVRRVLASRGDVQPEILYYLASDPDPEVRREVARNDMTPRQADLLLARDADAGVRQTVATKIAQVAPGLGPSPRSSHNRLTTEALEVLARDQVTMVRSILAEALKDVPNAPIGIVEQLARDRELVVCGPLLEYSPVLSDELLLDIIRTGPARGALSAISRRDGVAEVVADAIVDSGDGSAVAELLGNHSAQIREETLDRIIDAAPDMTAWHAPLVQRPSLPPAAARRIASFVARSLLDELQQRSDLDAGTLAAVAGIVERRLDEGVRDPKVTQLHLVRPAPPVRAASATVRVHDLADGGNLDEAVVTEALAAGDRAFVIAAMAYGAGVAEGVIEKAAALQNGKALVALAWKAGFTMALAVRLQTQLAGIPPSGVLAEVEGRDWPLSQDEMDWQIEFVAGMAG
ncbi:MAG: DUF2336 domain-containing protein [Alphaproteobacteria bacterium]